MHIILISTVFSRANDEGVKKFAYSIGQEWLKLGHQLLWLNLSSQSTLENLETIDPWLRQNKFPESIRNFAPDLIVYLPDASLNVFSALRSRLLSKAFPHSKIMMIALQPTRQIFYLPRVIRAIKGFNYLIVQSKQSENLAKHVGVKLKVLPSGVDRHRFFPVEIYTKIELRKKHKLSGDLPVILHVGHLRTTRNINSLLPLQQDGIAQLIIVGSSSTPQDLSLKQKFRIAGAIVIDTYLEHIEELYQLADLYVFPVVSPNSAIEFPLSVLEALACGLPVVSTYFGGLPDYLTNDDGIFFTQKEEIIQEVKKVLAMELEVPRINTCFSWEHISQEILFHSGLQAR